MAASGAHSDETSQDIQIVLILSSPKNRLYSIYHQTRSPLRPSAAEINTPTHLSNKHTRPQRSQKAVHHHSKRGTKRLEHEGIHHQIKKNRDCSQKQCHSEKNTLHLKLIWYIFLWDDPRPPYVVGSLWLLHSQGTLQSQKMLRPVLSEICLLLYKTVENSASNVKDGKKSNLYFWTHLTTRIQIVSTMVGG